MTKQPSQKKAVSEKVLILLAIMGIAGLIILAFGIYSILEISKLTGIILLALGVLVYILFILIEKKLKLI